MASRTRASNSSDPAGQVRTPRLRLPRSGVRLPAGLVALLPILADIVIPTAVYLLLHRLGVGDVWALTAAGAATGVHTAIATVRRRRLDGIGLLVVCELALAVLLLSVTQDPRLVLARPAFYTALSGTYLLASCLGQPIVYHAARPMAVKGDPRRAVAYERTWDRSAEFRRRERLITAGIGAALLVESVLRVVVVYSLPPRQVEESVLLSQVPGLVLLVVVIVLIRSQVPALRRLVDVEQARLDD
ncbi:MAG TPA: VC0807 family protein [Mycobacteriales bacterium]